ncbi:4-(cytidine 5'-diphospho)-2-C-methyl-D-erythritol kinase [Vallitaleaceae bacterium 9-2]
MREIKLKARAKINISLDVIGRRDNGYHDVLMIMQTINLYDKLLLRKQKENQITIHTNLPYLPVDERNLVYKIIQFMKEKYAIDDGVYVDLYKMIPVAAGMAGGSSDAAQTIIGMNKLFQLRLSQNEMMDIGEQFGADIPYCIMQGTVLASGLGEQLEVLDPFPKAYVLIAKPRFSVSTPAVYQRYDDILPQEHPDTDTLLVGIQEQNIQKICAHLGNVLESVTIEMHPEIAKIKVDMLMLGAQGSLMSGSGPTVYGLFTDKKKAEQAKKRLRKEHNLQFVYLTTIYNRKRD